MFCGIQSLQEFEVVTTSRDSYAFLMPQWTHVEFGTLNSGSRGLQSGPVTKQGLSNLKTILFKRRVISPSKSVSEEEGDANSPFRKSLNTQAPHLGPNYQEKPTLQGSTLPLKLGFKKQALTPPRHRSRICVLILTLIKLFHKLFILLSIEERVGRGKDMIYFSSFFLERSIPQIPFLL